MSLTQSRLSESTTFINTQSAGKYLSLWAYWIGNHLLTVYHWFLSLRKVDYSHAEHSSCLWVFLCCWVCVQRLSRTNLTRSQTQFSVSSNPKPFLILNLCNLQLPALQGLLGPIPCWCPFWFPSQFQGPNSCSSPGSCQEHKGAERQLGVFFTHSSEQCLIYFPKNLLGYDPLFLPAKEKDAGGSFTFYWKLFPKSFKIQLLSVKCLLSSHLRFGLMTIGCFGWGIVSF